jgi:hypothetical protein
MAGRPDNNTVLALGLRIGSFTTILCHYARRESWCKTVVGIDWSKFRNAE